MFNRVETFFPQPQNPPSSRSVTEDWEKSIDLATDRILFVYCRQLSFSSLLCSVLLYSLLTGSPGTSPQRKERRNRRRQGNNAASQIRKKQTETFGKEILDSEMEWKHTAWIDKFLNPHFFLTFLRCQINYSIQFHLNVKKNFKLFYKSLSKLLQYFYSK